MLFGEHAVVYKKPCIVTSVDQRMFVTLKKIESPNLVLHAKDLGLDEYIKPIDKLCTGVVPKSAEYIEHTISLLTKRFTIQGGIEIETHAEFSEKYGFGSSSASTVCTVKGFSELFSIELNKREIFELAYAVVLDIKGVCSGYDIAAAVYGGTLYYVGGGGKILPINIPKLPLAIGYTGIKADTPLIVKELEQKMKKVPKYYEDIFDKIENIVEQARISLEKGDWEKVGKLMNENEELLASLDVECPELIALTSAARNSGAWGAKLSGAGRGDCMIALSKDVTATEKAITAARGVAVRVGTNVPGVMQEE